MLKAYGEKKKIAKKTLDFIQQLNEIIEPYEAKGMKITLRQLYYQCVSKCLIKNNKTQYSHLGEIVNNARFAGLLDWNVIEDRTRCVRVNSHWNNPQEIINAAAEQYRIDVRATQPIYLEAWIEKDSLVSILEQVCEPLDVPFFSSRGFTSITALHDAALRFKNQNRKSVILYAGDHDPSGLKISSVIRETLKTFGADVELKRIGLTVEQIRELNLPPFFAKESDKNYKQYVKDTGLTQAWELDALPPEYLAEIFRSEIEALTDGQKLQNMIERENADKTYFEKFVA